MTLQSSIRTGIPLINNIISSPGNSFPYNSPSKYNISIQSPSRINYSIKENDSNKYYPIDSVASPLRQSREIVISRTLSPLYISFRNEDNKFGKNLYLPNDYGKIKKHIKSKKVNYLKKERNNK